MAHSLLGYACFEAAADAEVCAGDAQTVVMWVASWIVHSKAYGKC
jgi:hypothetical protein